MASGDPVLEGNFFPHAVDQHLRFRLTDVRGGGEVTLRLTMENGGEKWESWATFAADRSGFVNPDLYSPLEGTYEEADQMGLFWSMLPVNEGGMFIPGDIEPLRYEISIEVGGSIGQTISFQRFFQAPGVERREIREEGLIGTYFTPPGEEPVPAVLILGGSEGGLEEYKAALLANRGYATLALAYFAKEGLPEQLVDIPLEYFQAALSWLTEQEKVRDDSIIVLGNSKGGEAALLLGTLDKRVAGVIGVVPSSVVWQGLDQKRTSSSWTIEGEPLSYVSLSMSLMDLLRNFWSNLTGRPREFVEMYEKSLQDEKLVREAAIPVEEIGGPILLISGGDDLVWPSSEMSAAIVRRLRENDFPHEVKHLDFPEAGHIFRAPYLPAFGTRESDGILFGGNPGSNSRAEAESWQEILTFLANF